MEKGFEVLSAMEQLHMAPSAVFLNGLVIAASKQGDIDRAASLFNMRAKKTSGYAEDIAMDDESDETDEADDEKELEPEFAREDQGARMGRKKRKPGWWLTSHALHTF